MFITGLHNKPEDGGVSVASAAGPFTTNKEVVPSQNSCYHEVKDTDRNTSVEFTNFIQNGIFFCCELCTHMRQPTV
jgi:hypothetical protein